MWTSTSARPPFRQRMRCRTRRIKSGICTGGAKNADRSPTKHSNCSLSISEHRHNFQFWSVDVLACLYENSGTGFCHSHDCISFARGDIFVTRLDRRQTRTNSSENLDDWAVPSDREAKQVQGTRWTLPKRISGSSITWQPFPQTTDRLSHPFWNWSGRWATLDLMTTRSAETNYSMYTANLNQP